MRISSQRPRDLLPMLFVVAPHPKVLHGRKHLPCLAHPDQSATVLETADNLAPRSPVPGRGAQISLGQTGRARVTIVTSGDPFLAERHTKLDRNKKNSANQVFQSREVRHRVRPSFSVANTSRCRKCERARVTDDHRACFGRCMCPDLAERRASLIPQEIDDMTRTIGTERAEPPEEGLPGKGCVSA